MRTAQAPMEAELTGTKQGPSPCAMFLFYVEVDNICWYLFSSHICAGDIGKDSCQDDSGGPMFLPENGRWTLNIQLIFLEVNFRRKSVTISLFLDK